MSKHAFLYDNQPVRDLAWIFSSPSLFSSSALLSKHQPLDLPWFGQLDKDFISLEKHLSTKNMNMIGGYFEALWEFYLGHSPDNRLIASNIQVFADNKCMNDKTRELISDSDMSISQVDDFNKKERRGRTLGEFDFIYYNKSSAEYRHLEVAIKYYLGVPEPTRGSTLADNSSMNCWYGPATRDRLDIKLNKLVRHQSKLSLSQEGREVLQSLGLNQQSIENIKREICLSGYLFYPMKEVMLPPSEIHPQHNRALWLHLSCLSLLISREHLWGVAKKPHWLSPVVQSADKLLDNQLFERAVRKHFAKSQVPVLYARYSKLCCKTRVDVPSEYLANPRYYVEQLIFIVPDSWPLAD